MKKLLALILIVFFPIGTFAITFPEGRATSGDLTITAGTTRTEDTVKSNITVLTNANYASTTIASATGFSAGDYVLIYQAQGTGAGNYEIAKIGTISGSSLIYTKPLTNTYQATKAQVIKINEYHNVTINSGGKWTASNWDGTTGGILIALLNGTFTQSAYGTTTAPTGFNGGSGASSGGTNPGYQGDSSTGAGATSASSNGMGGGAGYYQYQGCASGGGGGGYGAAGGGTGGCTDGGTTGGNAPLTSLLLGGGGGGGTAWGGQGFVYGGSGGSGAGMIFISSINTTLSGGLLSANGSNGTIGYNAIDTCGGGGSGGAIYLPTKLTLTLGTGLITSSGGSGGAGSIPGSAGGVGRIATLATTTVSGTASPTIDTTSNNYIYNLDNDAINMNLGASI